MSFISFSCFLKNFSPRSKNDFNLSLKLKIVSSQDPGMLFSILFLEAQELQSLLTFVSQHILFLHLLLKHSLLVLQGVPFSFTSIFDNFTSSKRSLLSFISLSKLFLELLLSSLNPYINILLICLYLLAMFVK